jgi:ribonucleotide reductase class II
VFLHSEEIRLIEWLSFQGLLLVEHPEADRLPLALRRSSCEALIGFIAGLIDTTSLRARNKSLGFKLHHEPMARHMQQVAEAVGLVFSIKEVAERDEPYWLLTLSRYWSDPESLALLGRFSVLANSRGCDPVSRDFGRNFFHVAKVEHLEDLRITGDISVAGASDDDHWYWQGAIKSHNSKSLLTNASPGWHPPKATFYIRRITFAKDDPIALACMDYGYTIVPSQSDKDEQGRLLDDPFDPRCTEWLVEIPTATPWAHLDGAERCDPSKFSALAQFDFYMQVQQSYTTFNTSATLELTGEEIEPLAKAIHTSMEAGTGYISAALLARSDDKETYPRMPFEAVGKETYLQLCREVEERRSVDSFEEALKWRDAHVIHTLEASLAQEHGPAACDGEKCLLPQAGPNI